MDENNNFLQPDEETEVKKDRSLLYMGIGLAVIIMIMGYLTLFSDDPFSFFHKKPEVVAVIDDGSKSVKQTEDMSDDEVRKSLVKFIEAFYYDQRRGYFDPPSYFTPITDTYYNFHNLTYQRLRDIHNMRLADMKNLTQNWIVSSLEFTREDEKLLATYWLGLNYVRPSKNTRESGNVKMELIIDKQGKISSIREVETRNFESYELARPDSLIDTLIAAEPGTPPPPPETTETKYEGKVYDLGTVETVPEYPGGQKELGKYIGQNIRYPAEAREKKIQGKVYVGFIVEKNGDLSDLKIIKGIGYGCDEEAMRVLKNCPAWHPGLAGGKPVRTSYVFPLTFQVAN